MMTISNDIGCQFVGEINVLDAFSAGAGMLLKAMSDEFDTPVSTTATGRSAVHAASKTIADESDASALRVWLETAAARLPSTVICIKPSGRSAYGSDLQDFNDRRRSLICALSQLRHC